MNENLTILIRTIAAICLFFACMNILSAYIYKLTDNQNKYIIFFIVTSATLASSWLVDLIINYLWDAS